MKKILIAAIAANGVIGRTKKTCPTCNGTGEMEQDHGFGAVESLGCRGCLDGSGVIPCNELPWPPGTYKEDMARFKATTMGHGLVMGKNTWASLPSKQRPLPGRQNIVVTSEKDLTLYAHPDVSVARDLAGAIACAETIGVEECFLIGGVRIFEEGLSIVDELDITFVKEEWPGDVFFPSFVRTEAADGSDRDTFVVGDNRFELIEREMSVTNPWLEFSRWRRA